MAFRSLSTTLPFLSEREAIQDALYRGTIGLDTADLAMFDSAFTKDAVWDVNGTILDGLDAIHSGCYNVIAKLDTTHFITNVRIGIEEDGQKASMTASALAQHYREGQGMVEGAPNLLTGVLYSLKLVKGEDGSWRSTYFRMRSVWREGDKMIAFGK